MSVYSDTMVLIPIVIMALAIYGLATIILKSKEIDVLLKEEKTSVNWYVKFFKRFLMRYI